jgi:regulatory protein
MPSPSSAPEALAAALRLLGARERSEAELTAALRRRGFEPEAIAAVIRRCRAWGYLNDARFARLRARQLMAQGRAVGPRVMADLTARGVDEDEARCALSEAAGEFPEEELLRSILERRYPRFCYATADDRERRRLVHFFLRRGFTLSLVLSILKEER